MYICTLAPPRPLLTTPFLFAETIDYQITKVILHHIIHFPIVPLPQI